MTEVEQIKQNNDDIKAKETVVEQLDSYINANKTVKKTDDATPYSSVSEIKNESLIKSDNIASTEDAQAQNKQIIRTYKSDVEETIQTNHLSSINIAMAESSKMIGQTAQAEKETKNAVINKSILILSLLLILGGALAFLVPQILIQIQYSTKPVLVETISPRSIMTVDLEEKINIKDTNQNRIGTTLKERIEQSATRLGQVKNIFLTEGSGTEEELTTSSKFLELIQANTPDKILRTLKDQYMFGLHNYNGNQSFLILKVGSYDIAFSGMLDWETTLWQDFKELFNLQTDQTTSSSSLAIDMHTFQDATFNNKDCRIIKNLSENVTFLYSIIDENTIVITTSVDTLKEIINRISKARIVTQ